MPVTLLVVDERRYHADAQVRQDLERIYAEVPEDRLPAASATDFITAELAAGKWFGCACFNDRLLGGVLILPQSDAWWLSQLCVRQTTRRRGVGTRLMVLLGAHARASEVTLRIATGSLPLADRLLVSKLGYKNVTSPSNQGLNAGEEYVEFAN